MSRRSKYSSRRRRGGRGGSSFNVAAMLKVLLIIGTVVVAGAVGGLILHRDLTTEKIDTAFCYDRPSQQAVASFLDASFTRGASQAQRRDFETALMQAYDAAEPNARVMVFTTTRDAAQSLLMPVISLCKPPATPQEQRSINAPHLTAPFLARRAETARNEYVSQVSEILEAAASDELAALNSPILSSIGAISRHPDFQGDNRRLYATSDFLENSEIAIFGAIRGDAPPYAVFEQRREFERVRPRSFNGTSVQILMVESGPLPRPGLPYISSAERDAFWLAYFRENGADDVSITPIHRGAE